MSTASRLISGSAASWAQIVVTLVAQVALVPIYLSHWSIVLYGIWLAIQALMSIIIILDYGHSEFLGYEFLRVSREGRDILSKYVWSGASFSVGISILQVVLLVCFLATGALPHLLGKATISTSLLRDTGLVLILQGIVYLFTFSVPGLLFRALAPFGYFPRMVWWNLAISVVTSITPAVAVLLGDKLLGTAVAQAVTGLLVAVFIYVDLFRLLRREQLHFCPPSLALGWRNFLSSLSVSGKWLLENARQQGVRIVLAPLAGAAGLAAFSTMRTGANVALQGLNTVVNPLMPELMRFLHQRDQARLETAFGTLWFVLVAALAPAMVIIQLVIEPLYLLWTRGKTAFNPLLFAALSLSVLIYAAAQPAIAVVKGNNLLRLQLILSAATAALIVGGIYGLVPHIGIVGAGFTLVLAEAVAAVGYQIAARRWLLRHNLSWPAHHARIANMSVVLAAVAMGLLILMPEAKWLILAGSLLLMFGNLWRYWLALPELATQQAMQLVSKLPGLKKVYVFKS